MIVSVIDSGILGGAEFKTYCCDEILEPLSTKSSE
jgi:hypothetical protein